MQLCGIYIQKRNIYKKKYISKINIAKKIWNIYKINKYSSPYDKMIQVNAI